MKENRTLKYMGLSIQTLPLLQQCLSVILDDTTDRNVNIYGLYINDEKFIAKEDADKYLFLEVSIKAANYINNKAPETVIESYIGSDKKRIVLVIEPKITNENWKLDFIKGEYSKIYEEKQFLGFRRTNISNFEISRNAVLSKNPDYWETFKKILDEKFNLSGELKHLSYDGRELDMRPILEEEILNYKPM